MTTTEAALRDQIGKLLADDPACNGRVTTWTIEQIAALSQPSPASSTAGEAKVEAYDQMREIAEELGYPSILEALEATPPASSGEPASVAGEADPLDVGFWKEKAEHAERERDVWKERAMDLRLSKPTPVEAGLREGAEIMAALIKYIGDDPCAVCGLSSQPVVAEAVDPSDLPSVGIWRHKKRGTNYEVIDTGTLQCAANTALDERPVVIYRGEDGKHWVRGLTEFMDGRFEFVAAHPQASPPPVQGEVTLERWPGYNEQSWRERFAELDRRHTKLHDRMQAAFVAALTHSQPDTQEGEA